jgi:hypothetical protein
MVFNEARNQLGLYDWREFLNVDSVSEEILVDPLPYGILWTHVADSVAIFDDKIRIPRVDLDDGNLELGEIWSLDIETGERTSTGPLNLVAPINGQGVGLLWGSS